MVSWIYSSAEQQHRNVQIQQQKYLAIIKVVASSHVQTGKDVRPAAAVAAKRKQQPAPAGEQRLSDGESVNPRRSTADNNNFDVEDNKVI